MSGKQANTLQIYLIFNETYETFHQFFNVWSDICYWEQHKILQFWIIQARPRFAFYQFHGRKCLFACRSFQNDIHITQSRGHGWLFPSKQSTKPPELNDETL